MAAIVTASDLSVRWAEGGTPDATAVGVALEGVTLSIDAGEVVGIVGDTGSGGSTLLRCLMGIVPQLVPAVVDGSLDVCGRDPRLVPVWEMARHVAIVLDDPDAQASQATVAGEVAFGLENLGVEVGEMRRRVHEALAQTGLTGFGERNPLSLSGGEQQRLAVACAVAMRPSLLLMDGPTTNLDRRSGRGLLRLVRSLADERGLAVVIATHDVELLAEHADRIVVLDAGRIVLDASTEQAFSALARRGAAAVPQVTMLAAQLDAGTGPLPVTTESAIRWLAART